jgi:hypothetical protein
MKKIALFGKEKPLLNYLSPLTGFKDFGDFSFVFPGKYSEEDKFSGVLIEFPHEDFSSITERYYDLPILILYNSKTLTEKDLENLENICQSDSPIRGLMDSEVALTFQLPVLREVLLGIETRKVLGDFLARSLIDLERIKEAHKKMVPIRSGSSNGINYFAKFASGESSGGEFFNFHNKNMENMFFFMNTDSYAISNLVLTAYEGFNFEEFNLSEFKKFLGSIALDKVDFGKNKLEILIASIDRKNLKIEGYNSSSCRFFIDEEVKTSHISLNKDFAENLDDAIFSFKIDRGERLYIISSGYFRNMEKYYPGFEIDPLLKKAHKLPAGEALNELFFQLKRKVDGKFPIYDSSVIIVEVDKNVLFQV